MRDAPLRRRRHDFEAVADVGVTDPVVEVVDGVAAGPDPLARMRDVVAANPEVSSGRIAWFGGLEQKKNSKLRLMKLGGVQ